MKFKTLMSTAAMSGMLFSGAALATPFTIDASGFRAPIVGTDGITGLISQLGLNWSATSTFTDLDGNGVDIGDSVLDTGFGSINSYLDSNAQSLNNLQTNEGLNSFYNIGFSYSNLIGTVAFNDGDGGILANYTSGTISIFLNGDPLDELIRLNVTGSTGSVGNLLIFAQVAYAAEDTFFFNGVTDWTDYPLLTIDARVDFNLDPKVPGQIGDDTQGRDRYQRTATLDGSAAFDVNEVPEPGIIALLGLGLIGVGAARRYKKSA